MPTHAELSVDLEDVDAQYLISLGDLLASAAIALLPVEVLTATGHVFVGVPAETSRGGPSPDVRWSGGDDGAHLFRIGRAVVRLDEVVRCTIHARDAQSEPLSLAEQLSPDGGRSPAPPAAEVPSPDRPSPGAPSPDAAAADSIEGKLTASLHVRLPADADAPEYACDMTAALLGHVRGVEKAKKNALLIVSELARNVVLHAYDLSEPGPLIMDLALSATALTILISDEGRGPGVSSPQPGPGVGWKLVAELSQDFTIIHRGEGGTLVQARLNLR